jgi:hypothetical protein
MTCRYHILPEYKLCVFTASGDVTADEGVEAIRMMARDPAWQTGCSLLWDARRISSLDISLQGSASIISAGREFLAHVQVVHSAAIFTREIDIQMFSFLSKAISLKGVGCEPHFFGTLEQACKWLEVPTSAVTLK